MKVQYISSACVLIEHKGVRILCDPWLTEGIYFGSWYHYPLLPVGPQDFHDVDYIYITHVHPDHCDADSLKTFPKNIPILILEYEEKFLLHLLKKIGFENIIEVRHKELFTFSPDFFVEILAADNCDPTLCGRWFDCHIRANPQNTLQIDSMAVFTGGGKTLVNTNDCPFQLSKSVCEYILQKYREIDFLLVGYSGAGPYPQCFENLSSHEKIEKANAKKEQFLNQAISYLQTLKPHFFLPFAGQYTLGGKLSHLNHYRGVPELEDLNNLFKNLLEKNAISSQMVLLNSMETFDISQGKASAPFTPPNPQDRQKYIQDVLSQKSYPYEADSLKLGMSELYEKLENGYQHMKSKLIYYGFSTPTHVYLDVGTETLFSIPFHNGEVSRIKANEVLEPFVKISLHPGLLHMILKRQAHWNNAEIGSHLSFRRAPDIFERGIYHFLCYLN